MKLLMAIISCCALPVFADGVFVVNEVDESKPRKSCRLENWNRSTNACDDYGTNRCYLVVVSDAEYAAGWAVFPQARKDAAKAAAGAERTDFAVKFDRLLKAFALVTLDEINILRVKAGLAPRTVDQLKTAVRNKYQETP